MLLLLVDNTDLSELAYHVKYESSWNNGPSILKFEYPSEKAQMYPNGCTVTFTYGSANIFYGFLFRTRQDKKSYQCTCYDQLRYLKSKNTILRQNETLTSFMNTVALNAGDRIRLGNIDQNEYVLGKYLFDNKTHLDMLYQSIADNLVANGYYYTLFDNFGALDLRDTLDLRLPLVIGDASLATGFTYEKSIDDDTYNYIKVAKDDKEKGVRNVYITQDSSNMAKWGKLMLYEKVSADMNDAQLAERAKQLLQIKNRETETLRIECMGDVRIRGGSGFNIQIAEAGVNLWAVTDSVTHEFSSTNHTMTVNLLFGRWWNGLES